MYLDLFEPYPREERRIKEKDSTPPGYNITLILPQCVCLKSKLSMLNLPKISLYIKHYYWQLL